MQAYLQTDPKYATLFSAVWLWSEFPFRKDFGGKDTGVDLVAKTLNGDYWAVQCKCFAENATIDKPAVDSFLSTSSRSFIDDMCRTTTFAHRLWISTTNNWGINAEEAIRNQQPAVSRIGLYHLESAPVNWSKLKEGIFGEPSRLAKKKLFPHQEMALTDAHVHFTNNDRGKLIMACGTGKTFTSLKIAENETNGKGLILFLVPSIALLGQTLEEWYAEADEPIKAICICSDAEVSKKKTKNEDISIDSYINLDPTKFSWNRNQRDDLQKGKMHKYYPGNFTIGFYRPFCKNNLYFDKDFNAMLYMNKRLFPYAGAENRVICLSGVGASKDFSVLMTDSIPDLQVMFNGQCFPLYHYEERKVESKTLFDDDSEDMVNNFVRRDAISDFILERVRKAYGGKITKEDIFYYIYGILHNTEYRTAFAADLKKMLPRIPLVDEARDFWSFSKAGRKLADLHLNYETQPAAQGVIVTYGTIPQDELEKGLHSGELKDINYRVEKMRFPSKGDKSRIIYNSQITIEHIPAAAYEYIVNGKSAIEWIMERYAISTHKDSGITNDPNLWATEHNNPRYILDLLLSVIRLSVESVEIVRNLPKLTF